MRILAAFLIIISLLLLVFGLLHLEAHAPPEAKTAAPFMIGGWAVLANHRHHNSREDSSQGVIYSVVRCWS